MHLTSYLQDGNLTVELTGEIDHHCAKRYMLAVAGKIEAYTPQCLVLDFQKVSFMDSSGIAIVINALRAMRALDGELMLEGLKDQPMKVFCAAGVDKLIKIREEIR